jgi:predicted metal-dependent HD superfamily phosphohydrolase
MSVTLASWNQTWQAVGATRIDETLFHRLIACYSEPHRRYHTLQHLRECFEQLDAARDLAQRPAEIALALWFHDACYDVHRDDNEARSADWARRAVVSSGAPADTAERVHALIMATVHEGDGGMPQDPDTCVMLDVDLSILGSPPARFDESDAQIRAEYAHVPDAKYREGRMRALGGFLARERLYCTERFHQACEQRARSNLGRALERLAALTGSPESGSRG